MTPSEPRHHVLPFHIYVANTYYARWTSHSPDYRSDVPSASSHTNASPRTSVHVAVHPKRYSLFYRHQTPTNYALCTTACSQISQSQKLPDCFHPLPYKPKLQHASTSHPSNGKQSNSLPWNETLFHHFRNTRNETYR